MTPLIRDLRPEDYSQVADLLVETYRPYFPSSDYLETLADVKARADAPETWMLGAFDAESGALLGTTVLAYADSPYSYLAGEADGELRMLGVAASARRRGVGAALVREAIARCRLAGRRRMILGTIDTMREAHRLYEALGFERIGEHEDDGYRVYVYALELAPWPTVRKAEPSEYDKIGELTVEAYAGDGLIPPGSGYADELRDARRRAAEAELYVAVQDGELLGGVTYCPDGSPFREISRPDEGEFRMLAVAKPARGRGAGEALIRTMLARAREDGNTGVVISTAHAMVEAHRLYERLGFRRAPERDWSPLPGHALLAYARPV